MMMLINRRLAAASGSSRAAASGSSRAALSVLQTPLVKKNKLDAAFAECDTKQELEQLVLASSKYDFNSWNVMTAFSRLGRLGKPVDPAVYSRLLEIERDMRKPDTSLGQTKFSHLELETIATGVALGPLAQELPPFVVRELRSVKSFAAFQPNSLANLAYAFGSLQHVDLPVVGRLVEELADNRQLEETFTANQLSLLAQTLGWWYVAAEGSESTGVHLAKRDALYRKLNSALLAKSNELSGKQLANALHGNLRAHYSGDELFDFACQRFDLAGKIQGPGELANLLHAVAVKKPYAKDDLFDKAAPVLLALHNKFTPKQINLLFASFAEAKWNKTAESKHVLAVLKNEVERRGLAEHLDVQVLNQSLAELGA